MLKIFSLPHHYFSMMYDTIDRTVEQLEEKYPEYNYCIDSRKDKRVIRIVDKRGQHVGYY